MRLEAARSRRDAPRRQLPGRVPLRVMGRSLRWLTDDTPFFGLTSSLGFRVRPKDFGRTLKRHVLVKLSSMRESPSRGFWRSDGPLSGLAKSTQGKARKRNRTEPANTLFNDSFARPVSNVLEGSVRLAYCIMHPLRGDATQHHAGTGHERASKRDVCKAPRETGKGLDRVHALVALARRDSNVNGPSSPPR